jgi:hypothetical protein
MHRSSRRALTHLVRLSLAALVVAPTLVSAQQALADAPPAAATELLPESPASPTSPTSSAALPSAEAARAAAVRPVAAATAQERATSAEHAVAPRRQGLGQPVALMLVGGAALLAGLIIGGDAGTLIAVGGVVAGGIGLYQYLR